MRNVQLLYLGLLCLLLLVMGIGLVAPLPLKDSCDADTTIATFETLRDLSFIKENVQRLETIVKKKVNFRNTLIHWNSFIKFRFFNSSINTDQAVIGKDGWLYYSSKSDKIYESFTRQNRYRYEELKAALDKIQSRTITLANNNIQYCHAIWPNKSTIYPEHLPDRYKRQQQTKASKMTQFFNGNNSNSLPLVDIRDTLMYLKDATLLYLKHDSHWNDLGAYYAYVALMQQLHIQPYPLSDFEVSWETSHKGDLLSLIGLCNATSITEKIPVLKYKGHKVIEKIERDGKTGPLFSCAQAEQKKTLLMFRDSYGSALRQFISLHFETAYYPWTQYDAALVKELEPDVVICAQVERYL